MLTTYSVAIRTLGKAGEKYHQTLLSLANQTVQPTAIYVYIPFGYDLPDYSIGSEIYIRCEKGMIAQRALDFSEISDEWILFLDDDIYLPEHYVESALKIAINNKADMMSASFYEEYKASLLQKIVMSMHSVVPMTSAKWAYKVTLSGRFRYNRNRTNSIMQTQTGPGACMLCKKSTYIKSRFYEEKWMDAFGYALGDDQLFHYKMYLQGAREFMWNDSGAIHLDAGKQNRRFDYTTICKMSSILYLIWFRSIYNLRGKSILYKSKAVIAFCSSFVLRFFYSFIYIFKGLLFAPLFVIKGLRDGIRFTREPIFQNIPLFNDHIE